MDGDCTYIVLRIGMIIALNESGGIIFRATHTPISVIVLQYTYYALVVQKLEIKRK